LGNPVWDFTHGVVLQGAYCRISKFSSIREPIRDFQFGESRMGVHTRGHTGSHGGHGRLRAETSAYISASDWTVSVTELSG
jgi:hypothetical protein